MVDRVDLLVIGAGPAGAAAAITAAGSGRNVIVVDRATFPRDKTCGDGLTTGALRWLETLGVAVTALGASASVRDVVLVAPSGRQITVPLPRAGEYARVMRRVDLDAALVDRAVAAGAEVRQGAELVELKSLADGVEATLADGSVVQAPFAIAADGHYSTARRLLSPTDPPVRGEWSAFRQYFSGVDDARLWVFFERDLLPGYAWVFPLPGGRVNVGFGMLRGVGVNGKVLARTWRELLGRPTLREVLGPDAEPEAPVRAWPIPSHLDPARLSHGRVLFAGDAAGVVDPMTGEGIAQALETGALAARAVGETSSAAVGAASHVARQYRGHVERALRHDLRFAAQLQRVLAHPRGAELALRTVDLNAWTRANFARWMFEDYPRALLLTPSRWHRAMFTPTPAYP